MEKNLSAVRRAGSNKMTRGNHIIEYESTIKQDLVLIVGQNAVGKTTTFNKLTEEAEARNIPYEPEPISDLFFLLKEVQADDKAGGHKHYHEWCREEQGKGHNHQQNEPVIPFTVTDNSLIDDMFNNFFQRLNTLPITGKIWFAEWTGGANINPDCEPASQIDLSFRRVTEMFRKQLLPTNWLSRVCAIIHPKADSSIRYGLNEKKHSHQLHEIATGKVSPKKTITNLNIFGKDDFHMVKNLFIGQGIAEKNIYIVDNGGNEIFYTHLQKIADEIFTSAPPEADLPGKPISKQYNEVALKL